MDFSGSVTIAAARDAVWDFVSDPARMGGCGPGVESVEVHDDGSFTAVAKVGFGAISARFKVDAEFTDRTGPDHAAVHAHGKAPGSAVDGDARMTLRDGDEAGTTIMDWTADVQISGMIASLGARLVRGTAEKLIGKTFTCVKATLET